MSYTHNLSHANDKLRSFQSYLKWMWIDQFNTRYVMVSSFLFFLLGVFVSIASNFILSYTFTYHAYDVMLQLPHTSLLHLS
ncbi:hypothetical protein BHE74_00055876 [Ensete ventricosum]|nr:hypothetical protein GW17_00023480 [Ensete ventricosum]RWW38853.1 hypothetical protein BHE74_00055876 [Ensete ventricosum]RZS15464.1 hypothetical protein BHM03_00047302 [Ensete ventricosum]